jgi:prophage tail gpP-like protein
MGDFVTLTVNGKAYGGFKSVRIESGIERMARSFEVSVTDRWPGSVGQVRRIVPGDLCEVRIGDDLLCTCYVDATPIDYGGDAVTIMVRGRSKTADLVDCAADNPAEGGQFKNLKVEAVAEKISKQYGIKVVAETDTGAAISEHQIQQGESVFESLERLAKQRQVLVSDNAAGDLVLVSPGGGGKAASALELGINILSASAGFDYTEVYSDYSVKGQVGKRGNDSDWDGTSAANLSTKGQATDKSVKRKRVFVVRQSGHADAATCQKRAEHEQRIRAAKAGEIRYTVAGWRQKDGSLWRPNITVAIKDAIMGIAKDLLVSEVIWTLDEGGMVAELVCISPDAYLST